MMIRTVTVGSRSTARGEYIVDATVAGIYDYYLGGTASTATERRLGAEMLATLPVVRRVARANRAFLHRAVRHLVRLGVRQFIDIGSGLPTMGNTHAVADGLAPGTTTVIYVDNDPDTVARSRSLIHRTADPTRHVVIEADLRDPDRLWSRAADTGLIDRAEPVGLLLIAVLHIRQPDDRGVDRAHQAVARCRELLPAGSYLALSHATNDGVPAEIGVGLSDIGRRYGGHGTPVTGRSRAEITALFGDFELVPPGVTWAPLWHPAEAAPDAPTDTFDTPAESAILAGVARKP
jgi:hypothetical protein